MASLVPFNVQMQKSADNVIRASKCTHNVTILSRLPVTASKFQIHECKYFMLSYEQSKGGGVDERAPRNNIWSAVFRKLQDYSINITSA
jgi:hypothetical protein